MNNSSFVHIPGDIAERVALEYMQRIIEPRLSSEHAILLSHLPFHFNGHTGISSLDGHKVLYPREVLKIDPHYVYGAGTGSYEEDTPFNDRGIGNLAPLESRNQKSLCAVSKQRSRILGPWPMPEAIYHIRPGGLFDKFEQTLDATNYRPDFVFIGCDQGVEERINVQDAGSVIESEAREIVPRQVYVFEVKSSDPRKSRSYTPNQRKAKRVLRDCTEMFVMHIPVRLENDFLVNIYPEGELQ